MAKNDTQFEAGRSPVPLRGHVRHLKHLLATSRLAQPLGRLRALKEAVAGRGYPELTLLRAEEGYMEEILGQTIGEDWNCLDVGGHLGKMSFLLERLAPKGKLTIVEALPDKADMLRRRFPQAKVHAVAVSDAEGEADFFENIDSPGMSSLSDRASRGATRKITVPLRRLDDLLGEETKIRFIKIDVEGFEYPALRGASQLLARDRPILLFEAGSRSDDDLDGGEMDALLTWLNEEQDYDVFAAFDVVFGRPPVTADRFASYRTYPFMAFNYLAYPRESADHPNKNRIARAPGATAGPAVFSRKVTR